MRMVVALVAFLALAGCAQPWPGQGLAGFPGLAAEVRSFYDRNAWERSATCVSPRMQAITRAEVVAQDGDEMLLLVRYAWRDETDDDPFLRACEGFADREFVIDTSGDLARVVAMSGEQRPARGASSGRG